MRSYRTTFRWQFFTGLFTATDDGFLTLYWQAIPQGQIMLPTLGKDITPSGIFTLRDNCHLLTLRSFRILSPVNKTAQIPIFSPAESVCFLIDVYQPRKVCTGCLAEGEINIMPL